MKNPIKPIHVMNEPGLTSLEKDAFFAGLKEILQTVGVYDIFMKHDLIKDFGIEEGYDCHNKNSILIAHPSVDLYLQDPCWDKDHEKLNILRIIELFGDKPYKKDEGGEYNYYDVMIAHSDIYDPKNTDAANKKLNGVGSKGFGAIISTYKFKKLDDKLKSGCIETLTMHELGHMFGLLPKERTENIYFSGGKHCDNMCVMKQGRRISGGYQTITKHRLKHEPFCSICERDLKNYFRHKEE